MATFSIDSLLNKASQLFSAGDWAYLTFLSGTLATGLSYTVNPLTNILTTPTPHGLVTGSRVRLVGGTLPAPTLANTDYYVLFASATTFKLALSAADVALNNPIDLTDAGAGALTLTEQSLKPSDLLSVLLNKEIVHPSLPSRLLVGGLGVPTNVSSVAQLPTKNIQLANNDAQTMSYSHHLYIESTALAAAAIGYAPPAGTGYALETLLNTVVLNQGDSRLISIQLRVRNA